MCPQLSHVCHVPTRTSFYVFSSPRGDLPFRRSERRGGHRKPERHQPVSPAPALGPHLLLRPCPAGLRTEGLGRQEGERQGLPGRVRQESPGKKGGRRERDGTTKVQKAVAYLSGTFFFFFRGQLIHMVCLVFLYRITARQLWGSTCRPGRGEQQISSLCSWPTMPTKCVFFALHSTSSPFHPATALPPANGQLDKNWSPPSHTD